MRPLVSVMMVVRNGQPFVRLAIESLLRQSLRDFELVVVDDGSEDNTLAEIEPLELWSGVRVRRAISCRD